VLRSKYFLNAYILLILKPKLFCDLYIHPSSFERMNAEEYNASVIDAPVVVSGLKEISV